MKLIGISAYYHDSAAALIEEGVIVAAAQEERFSRIKHDSRFPHGALRYCLSKVTGGLGAVDYIVFYEKPFLKFERLLETGIIRAPKGFPYFKKIMSSWMGGKLFQEDNLLQELSAYYPYSPLSNIKAKLLFSQHHLSHAASAFYPSPFAEAAVITIDGVGEWTTTGIFHGKQKTLIPLQELHFPHSLGLLYSAFTYYLGFKVNDGEYKVMGLAPYGSPQYRSLILNHLIDLQEDGSFQLNLKYFNFHHHQNMINDEFLSLFSQPKRSKDDTIQQFHMDIAASIQTVCEEVMLRIARHAKQITQAKNLCIAGGVGLNCVANGKILRENMFEKIWIQPAAGDAGGALGAALAAYHQHLQQKRIVVNEKDHMRGAYLGPAYSDPVIQSSLGKLKARYHVMDDEHLLNVVVDALDAGKVVGWFNGAMEFGPRALGHRSILADARNPNMQKILNLKVKNREGFRPFAPLVLAEDVQHWFEDLKDSPYMLLVTQVKKEHCLQEVDKSAMLLNRINEVRSVVPAITHVDFSARVQTVEKNTHARLHTLLTKFKEKTGIPILINTSFNVSDEPIVESPQDAYRCFMSTDIDMVVIENCLLNKEEQTVR
ncbi:MAG: hypothetical protein A3F10_04190 [Coxiella sp. RIFCSPHIGHO2_12_FULL_42_15]|nr:MAG: hypothetical protein A3F10_04190 [Coxiella sp. RIFCSPHIGHO2_12_FULL_42_15]